MIHLSRRAFTLVELLAVVIILAVLIALLLPAEHSARESARKSVLRSKMGSEPQDEFDARAAEDDRAGAAGFARMGMVWFIYSRKGIVS